MTTHEVDRETRQDVAEGLDSAPEAFCRLMRGENFGKALVRVAVNGAPR